VTESDTMNIRPLYDNILVQRAEAEERTSGGLFLPTAAQEKQVYGEVKAIGNGKVLKDGTVRAPAVKVGDKVLLAKWGGNEIKHDGQDYLILKESELLAVLAD
jgi:chaperonin GroES